MRNIRIVVWPYVLNLNRLQQPMSITIHTATTDDAPTLVQFNQAMARETEDKVLDADTLTAGVHTLMSDPAKGFYLIAERDGEPVGSLMITMEWSDWRNGAFWWVQSVYVPPEARRQGVYTALYAHVKQLATDTDGVCGIRLYVEQDNEGAQQTYEALGMERSHYQMYEEML